MRPTDPKYLAERFLAAYDAAVEHFRATELTMQLAIDQRSGFPTCIRIREFMAHAMRQPDGDEMRLSCRDVAKELGVSTSAVDKYVQDYTKRLEGSGVCV